MHDSYTRWERSNQNSPSHEVPSFHHLIFQTLNHFKDVMSPLKLFSKVYSTWPLRASFPMPAVLPPSYLGWGETWLPPSTPAEGQCTSTSAGCLPGARGRGHSSATFLWVQKTTSALGTLGFYSRLRHMVQVTLHVTFITIREPKGQLGAAHSIPGDAFQLASL